jgi:rubredoxin
MAKTKTTIASDEFDDAPIEWICDTCGKIKEYTDTEIEKAEGPKPGTKPEDWDYHIPCPFCKKGSMIPPTMTLAEGLQDIFDCDL